MATTEQVGTGRLTSDVFVSGRRRVTRQRHGLLPGERPSRVLSVIRYTVAILLAALFTYPFIWLVSASLKPRAQVFDNALIPKEFSPENYITVWQAAPVFTWFVNSIVVGVAAAASVTISSALVAFGFAYFRFPGRNLLFGLVLSTMMLPGAVTMIPVYLIWDALGFVNTQVPLWANNLFGSAFFIFLLRQFFLTLPRELFEAARVDGCGYFGLFRRIALPLCKPALIVVFIFEFRESWTDLIKPLIYLQDSALFTLPRGLKTILDSFGYGGEMKWEIVLAASVIATLPLIIIFFLGQRHFVEGISTTGRKG
ncbi:MAG TPA: carbohydrate ABC transporter permease [Actinopolymorphaceae bacterium]|jgi:multiple sugar transport system permease protein